MGWMYFKPCLKLFGADAPKCSDRYSVRMRMSYQKSVIKVDTKLPKLAVNDVICMPCCSLVQTTQCWFSTDYCTKFVLANMEDMSAVWELEQCSGHRQEAWCVLNSAELLCLLNGCESCSVHAQGSSANTTVHPLAVACDSQRWLGWCLQFLRISISNPGYWIMGLWWNWGRKGPLEMVDHHVPLKVQFTDHRMIVLFSSWFWFWEWRSVAMSVHCEMFFFSHLIKCCFSTCIVSIAFFLSLCTSCSTFHTLPLRVFEDE